MRAQAPASLERARAAKAKTLERLQAMGIQAAVGVARMGEGYVLSVALAEPLPGSARLPRSVEGVPLRAAVVGRVQARRRRR